MGGVLLSPAGARVVTTYEIRNHCTRNVAVPRRGASCYTSTARITLCLTRMLLSPAGARVVTGNEDIEFLSPWQLLSPAGARVVTRWCSGQRYEHLRYCPPQGREVLPGGGRCAGWCGGCCPPQGRELSRLVWHPRNHPLTVAVPRRGASCYAMTARLAPSGHLCKNQ